MLVTTWEQRYVSEPIETKYLKFCLLNLVGSSKSLIVSQLGTARIRVFKGRWI
jgi:hypothetical protein